MTEALDREGRSLVFSTEDKQHAERFFVSSRPGNFPGFSQTLREFDVDNGLKIFRGEVRLTTMESEEVMIPLEKGKEVKVPGGVLVVDSIAEHKKQKSRHEWRFTITYKTEKKVALREVLEARVLIEGEHNRWSYLRVPWQGMSFDVEASGRSDRPKWVKIRVRKGTKTDKIPFEFKDLIFWKKK